MNIENNIFVITDVCLYRIMHLSLKNAGMCVISSAHFEAGGVTESGMGHRCAVVPASFQGTTPAFS